jgi:REP-associated tyrosine transposase
MPRYRLAIIPGGTFFFTVAIANRSDDLLVREVDRLRRAYQSVSARCPFETVAICILQDHLHAIWSLAENDADFSRRWSLIKSGFREASTPPHRDPRAMLRSAKKDSGNAAIGSMRSATRPTWRAMSITSTSIR